VCGEAFISWAHVELPRKDNTFVGALYSLQLESLYAYQCTSLYASRGEVLVMLSLESVAHFCFRDVSLHGDT